MEVSGNPNDQNSSNSEISSKPLSALVISTIKKCPNYTIRPSRLAAQLGISIDDASAELCGLLAAVGGGSDGATFTFETKSEGQPPVMVFTFPPNFEVRAKRHERTESIKQSMVKLAVVGVNLAKVMIAFGLILSLLIVGIAVLIVLVSAFIALVTQQGNNNNHSRNIGYSIQRRMRMFRELLWCYAIFGGAFDDANTESIHPFFREVAMIMANVLMLFSGGGIFYPFFFMRINRSRRRLNHFNRSRGGFGGRYRRGANLEGVSDVRRGTWFDGDDSTNSDLENINNNQDDDPFRGFLSVAVEFLFGPTPFWPGPTDRLKWRLRAEIITSKPKGEISLKELAAFVDNPPKSTDDDKIIIASGLEVVTHFNGLPVIQNENNRDDNNIADSIFRFPELLAEADDGGLPTPKTYLSAMEEVSPTEKPWYSLLYKTPPLNQSSSSLSREMQSLILYRENGISHYLHEQRHKLTQLTSKQFHSCVALGLTNYFGIIWLRGSLATKGYLATLIPLPSLTYVLRMLAMILFFYAHLFFMLPLLRLLVIFVYNMRIDERNRRRKQMFQLITNSSGVSSASVHSEGEEEENDSLSIELPPRSAAL